MTGLLIYTAAGDAEGTMGGSRTVDRVGLETACSALGAGQQKGPDPLLVYHGARDDNVAQISSCMAITDDLRMTGLAKEPDVRPHSVVAWAGRRVLSEMSHIEAVAKALGARSLDRAASLISWEWREETEWGADS